MLNKGWSLPRFLVVCITDKVQQRSLHLNTRSNSTCIPLHRNSTLQQPTHLRTANMKFTAASIVALCASLAAAQTVADLPQCSVGFLLFHFPYHVTDTVITDRLLLQRHLELRLLSHRHRLPVHDRQAEDHRQCDTLRCQVLQQRRCYE